MTWVELCEECKGEGCAACDMEGHVPHGHQPDDLAVLNAQDDQLRADISRDAQILGHLHSELKANGITEERVLAQLLDSFYLHWLSD